MLTVAVRNNVDLLRPFSIVSSQSVVEQILIKESEVKYAAIMY